MATISLRTSQHALIHKLADSIQQIWHDQLNLSPYTIPEGLGYVEGLMEGEKLVIENHCYQAPQFRKLHLELAKVGNGLDILHCVMFPNLEYALPIFGADLVGSKTGTISAAIADLSPVHSDRALPPAYQTALEELTKFPYSQPRDLPPWGSIFSDFCLFVRPTGTEEEAAFLQQVQNFLHIHCQIASTTEPLTLAEDIAKVKMAQKNYCQQQQQNDKTRRVLEKCFGIEWTERYMTTMLFDYKS